MKQLRKNPIFSIAIFFAGIISIMFAIWISSIKPANAAVNNVNGISETTGVRYETIYVNGHKFLVFSSSSGSDIEVFPY